MSVLSREVRAVQNAALGSVLIWRTASQYQTVHERGSLALWSPHRKGRSSLREGNAPSGKTIKSRFTPPSLR
jgi:hypothetical protein